MTKTIEKTTWTSRPALKKMIEETAGNIAYPKKIEKVDDVQKTFKKLFLISGQNLKKNLIARNSKKLQK